MRESLRVLGITALIIATSCAGAPVGPSPKASAVACQECMFNIRCQALSDARNPQPCCDPIKTVLGNPEPKSVAECRAAYAEQRKREATEPECKTCLSTSDGRPCATALFGGNFDPRWCCEEVPPGTPYCPN